MTNVANIISRYCNEHACDVCILKSFCFHGVMLVDGDHRSPVTWNESTIREINEELSDYE